MSPGLATLGSFIKVNSLLKLTPGEVAGRLPRGSPREITRTFEWQTENNRCKSDRSTTAGEHNYSRFQLTSRGQRWPDPGQAGPVNKITLINTFKLNKQNLAFFSNKSDMFNYSVHSKVAGKEPKRLIKDSLYCTFQLYEDMNINRWNFIPKGNFVRGIQWCGQFFDKTLFWGYVIFEMDKKGLFWKNLSVKLKLVLNTIYRKFFQIFTK